MPYMPSDVSVVATNISKIREVKRSITEAAGGLSGLAKNLSPILNFDKEIKDRVQNVTKEGTYLTGISLVFMLYIVFIRLSAQPRLSSHPPPPPPPPQKKPKCTRGVLLIISLLSSLIDLSDNDNEID